MLCEGKKTKTLGRRYPKIVLPNVSYPLSTKASPAKTLGCEGKIEIPGIYLLLHLVN